MAKNPTIHIDWNAGEATLDIGTRLQMEDPLFKLDAIGDILEQTQDAYDQAHDQMYPGLQDRQQRFQNARRRLGAESLTGKTIHSAFALANGDLALDLGEGTVLVVCTDKGGVDIRVGPSLAQATEYAKDQVHGASYYTDEPSAREIANIAAQDLRNEALSHLLGHSR